MPTEIDARGLHCPWPVIKLQKTVAGLHSGDEVRLIATDPMARLDVPHFCQQSGHILVNTEERSHGDTPVFVFMIRLP